MAQFHGQEFWIQQAEAWADDEDLLERREIFLEQWSRKSPIDIQQKIVTVRKEIVEQERVDGYVEGERMGRIWQLAALEAALDVSRTLT